MNKVEQIKRALTVHRPALKQRFSVKKLGIFGSYIRGEQKPGSDLDVLVEFKRPIGLFEFMDLEEYLASIVKVKVDLVSKKALKPAIGERILREVVYI